MTALRCGDPRILILRCGGFCPAEAYGRVNGHSFYLKARDMLLVMVADDPDADYEAIETSFHVGEEYIEPDGWEIDLRNDHRVAHLGSTVGEAELAELEPVTQALVRMSPRYFGYLSQEELHEVVKIACEDYLAGGDLAARGWERIETC